MDCSCSPQDLFKQGCCCGYLTQQQDNSEDYEKTYINKSQWISGQWEREPDEVFWIDQQTKLPCLIARDSDLGYLNGCVGVSNWPKPFPKVQVYGRIIFDSLSHRHLDHILNQPKLSNFRWIGFDCAHRNDLIPAFLGFGFPVPIRATRTYKNIEFVRRKCEKLADDLRSSGVL